MPRENSTSGSSNNDKQVSPHACSNCQRRKQKCNREWPCDQCMKRKVNHLCNFMQDAEIGAWTFSDDIRRKRDHDSIDDADDWDDADGLEAMGYSAGHLLANLAIRSRPTTPEQYQVTVAQSPQLQRALEILPPRKTVDILVQNFLHSVNYYYYIIYPRTFAEEYSNWWKDRAADQPLGLPWTCLLIMICACSVQHTDATMAANLEADLGFPVKELTVRYHNAARELHSAIPVGNSHFYSVQYLLHSCYWFKAEARFVECWQVLGATVREAQALGLHLEPGPRFTNFQAEMRKRLWCIVDSWDWLVSCLLARPMLIDRTDTTTGLPSLTLEEFPVSPLLHLKLQSKLVGIIFKRFGPPKVLTDVEDIKEYQTIMENFMLTFPPGYAFENPDTSYEAEDPWIALHRHYMHTCTLSIALGPFRAYLAQDMTKDSPEVELQFRRDGINYALNLLNSVQSFFEWVWSRDSTFHFVPFCIFDTAALLCSSILHDKDGSIPQRERITNAIGLALATLQRLRTATETARVPHNTLRKIVQMVWGPMPDAPYENNHKRPRIDREPPPQPSGPATFPVDQSSYPGYSTGVSSSATSSALASPASATPPETYVVYAADGVSGPFPAPVVPADPSLLPYHAPPYEQSVTWNAAQGQPICITPMVHPPLALDFNGVDLHQVFANLPNLSPEQIHNFSQMSRSQLGDLCILWNWESLNLGFNSNPIFQWNPGFQMYQQQVQENEDTQFNPPIVQ